MSILVYVDGKYIEIERIYTQYPCGATNSYTLIRRALIHADCRWPSPTLHLYEMTAHFT